MWVDPDGTEEPIEAPQRLYRMPRLSPDGTRVAVVVAEGDTTRIWVHDLARGSGFPVTFGASSETSPTWTLDGRRIVFTSDRKWLISTSTVTSAMPVWSSDGGKLFYRAGGTGATNAIGTTYAMMSVTINTIPTLEAGLPELLFEDHYFRANYGRHYDVAENGRFLMIKEVGVVEDTAPLRQLNVVRNWVEELKERVPVN